MADISLQQVMLLGYSRFCAKYGVRFAVFRWAFAVMGCRTAVLGGHKWHCPECDEQVVVWNSCKHRGCPQCGGVERERWLEKMRRLLALHCGYHHVVFTVPHELIKLWQWNRSWFLDQVLGASRETLLQVLSEPRWLGGLPGLILTPHTWGRSLINHLHVHVLVTAGGWTADGWKPLKYDYLASSEVLRTIYRGKLRDRLLAGLSSGEMVLPEGWSATKVHAVLRKLYRKEWCVNVQPRYKHGQGVLTYLARYARGGPLREHQIEHLSETEVTFRYTDHRQKRTKTLTLPIEEFLFRLSEHVPDPGFHAVRYAGLYATAHRALLAQARASLGMGLPEEAPALTAQDFLERRGQGDKMKCSTCKCRYVQGEKIEPSGRAPPYQEYRHAA
jgi:hypothetical protein